MTEIDYILRHFEENFKSYKGRRIALSAGEYQEEILRNFDDEYHFHCVLEPESTQVPADVDLVILTDPRTGKEPDYNRIRRSCEEQDVLLMDPFGLDQIELHRELKAQEYLSIAQWKQLLSDYDVVTILISGAVARHFQLQDRWLIRPRFMTMYHWLMSQGKTVFFLWDTEEQIEPLRSEQIDVKGRLIRRVGNDQGFLQLALENKGKKMIHIGIGTARDGIIPREYGMDTRLFRYYFAEVSNEGREEWFCADKALLREAIDQHDVISFDIFDTLLKRTVLYPENVFDIVEEQTGVKGYAVHRAAIQAACPQFSMDEMYGFLKTHCEYDNHTLEVLRETEIKTEYDVILPRRGVLDMFEYAKAQQKTIVLISDMYLDVSVIRDILEKNGIVGYSKLYVSYQYK